MRDSHQLILTATIVLSSFLAAPWVIDQIPVLASLPRWLKVLACFAFPIVTFFSFIFIWAMVYKILATFTTKKKKLQMNAEEVKVIAERFLATRVAEEEAQDGPPKYRYILDGVNSPHDLPPFKYQWVVVFLVTDLAGDPVDKRTIVLVDDRTGDAKYIE